MIRNERTMMLGHIYAVTEGRATKQEISRQDRT